jgi:hypothetical protein
MPWGWDTRGPVDVALGGAKGTPQEAAIAHAWPNYEAQYLHKRLSSAQGKYNPTDKNRNTLNEVQSVVYLDKVAEDYKQEADECLRAEFNDWLQGKHIDNIDKLPYKNGPGKPRRRYVYRDVNQYDAIGAEWDNNGPQWQPTWWGTSQLTHLPGVREYLRKLEVQRDHAELQMNLLAEHGPQDLESAWMYFKHWVKGRPVGPEVCIEEGRKEPGMRSDYGRQMPNSMHIGMIPAEKNAADKATYDSSQQKTQDEVMKAVDDAVKEVSSFAKASAQRARDAARDRDREVRESEDVGETPIEELAEVLKREAKQRDQEKQVAMEEDNQAQQAGSSYADAFRRDPSPKGPNVRPTESKRYDSVKDKSVKDPISEGETRRINAKQGAVRKARDRVVGKQRVRVSVTQGTDFLPDSGDSSEPTGQRLRELHKKERAYQARYAYEKDEMPLFFEGEGQRRGREGENDGTDAIRYVPRARTPTRVRAEEEEIEELQKQLRAAYRDKELDE